MTALTRRGFTLAALSAPVTLAACANGVGSQGPAIIDARVDETLQFMFTEFPGTVELASAATGMLVMPLVTEVGLGVGGSFGRGALRIGPATRDYYSAAGASAGLQVGAQQFSHVLFFMTQDALTEFQTSPGWVVGADVEYVANNEGETFRADTTTALSPVIAVIFGQAGLRIGATLTGTKYTRIIP